MIRFSANLGFLWTNLALPDAIRAAAAAGFDAVECHTPYDVAPAVISDTLATTGLSMVSMNTRRGSADGDFGLAAVPGREPEARSSIAEAISYAAEIGCANVSVLAGNSGRTAAAELTYRENLLYASALAAEAGLAILIEPMNTRFTPRYHLVSVDAGVSTINALGTSNVRLMVDCFHARAMEGDLLPVIARAIDHIGHIQISAYPDRGEPDQGEVDYVKLLPAIVDLGYEGVFGAEYEPRDTIEAGLAWLRPWHSLRREEHTS